MVNYLTILKIDFWLIGQLLGQSAKFLGVIVNWEKK